MLPKTLRAELQGKTETPVSPTAMSDDWDWADTDADDTSSPVRDSPQTKLAVKEAMPTILGVLQV